MRPLSLSKYVGFKKPKAQRTIENIFKLFFNIHLNLKSWRLE